MSDASPPPAGWYPDPENASGQRWWNGSGWSDQKRAAGDAASAGFVYGSTGDARPDPYAAPASPVAPTPAPPAYSTPAYASPYVAPYGARAPGSTNALAIAGLIVSAGGWIIIPVIAPIVGVILSAFGLARAKQAEAAGNPNHGRGIALAGLIIGIVIAVLGILVIAGYVALMFSVASTSVYDY